MIAKSKTTPIKKVIRSRFKRDVRELKRECVEKNFNLMSFDEASDDDICILSEDEYEISFSKQLCSMNLPCERYFLSIADYYRRQEFS